MVNEKKHAIFFTGTFGARPEPTPLPEGPKTANHFWGKTSQPHLGEVKPRYEPNLNPI